MYADDTQIYISICPVTPDEVSQGVSRVEGCITDVHDWMSSNLIKLNADKSEVLVVGFRAQLAKFNLSSLQVAETDVPVQAKPVRNIGVMFDSGLTMSPQVSGIIHLINTSRARKLLTVEATETAVHTLVTSRLDDCNTLLIAAHTMLLFAVSCECHLNGSIKLSRALHCN